MSLPTALFEARQFPATTDDYAMSADGQRFLLKVLVAGDAGSRVHVVTNVAARVMRRPTHSLRLTSRPAWPALSVRTSVPQNPAMAASLPGAREPDR